jgi:Integrase core domain
VIPSVLSAMTVEPLSTLTAPDLIHCLMSLLTFLCGANARVSPPGPDRDMARVPDAACIEHVGLRLFSVSRPSCSRRFTLLRHPAREQGDLPRRSDAASDGRLGRAANRGMLRLGSSATAILDSRSRQPLWRELRSSRAGARNTASSYAFRSPRANAVAERWVRSVRSECLDHLIVFNEANLRRVLSAYVTYYNRWRPRRSLGQKLPCGEARPLPRQACREIVAEPVLSGLHHIYRAAG